MDCVFLASMVYLFVNENYLLYSLLGQLFWVDPATAHLDRQKNPVFKAMDIKENVIRSLDEMLRREHALAKLFKTAKQRYDEAFAEAVVKGLPGVANFRITLLTSKDAPEKIKDKKLHDRQVNLPHVDEIAAIHCSNSDEPPEAQGVKLTAKDGQVALLFNDHMLCDAATYPLIYPYGSISFHRKIPKHKKGKLSAGNTNVYVSKRQFFSRFCFCNLLRCKI